MFRDKINYYLVLVSVIIVLGACSSTKSIYYWGDYSESAYGLKAEPTAESLSTHKNVLQEIINKAQSKNQRIPPGADLIADCVVCYRHLSRNAVKEVFDDFSRAGSDSSQVSNSMSMSDFSGQYHGDMS